jgi:transposase
VCSVGHTILGIAYHVLDRGVAYEDLEPQYFDRRDRTAVERRLVDRLECLGYKVTLEPVTPAA